MREHISALEELNNKLETIVVTLHESAALFEPSGLDKRANLHRIADILAILILVQREVWAIRPDLERDLGNWKVT